MNSINDINYLTLLPESLTFDTNIVAFATAFNEQITKVMQLIKNDIIYFYIDNLSEEVLNVLAKDLKVDWYNTGYDIETKRSVIKNAVKVHKYKGTPYAVQTAVNSVLPGTSIMEWPEYGGQPYKFKIDLEAGKKGFNSEQVNTILRQVDFYKNKRSHLDAVNANITSNAGIYNAAMPSAGVTIEIEPYTVGSYTALAAQASVAGLIMPIYLTVEGV